MAVFSKVATTTLGLNLYAKVQAGAALNFTRMQIGGGQLPAGNDPAAQTALITPIDYFAINSISTSLNTAHIKGIFENTLINVDTYTCELGLFATDPDLGEILYAYANALAQGDTIPPISSGPLSKQFQINAAIGNSANVTATIPATTYVPTSDKGIVNGVATLDATTKVPIVQIPNMDIAHLPTGIPATNLADGSVTDTELEYINSLTSNAQTQITAIKTTADAAATNAALVAHEADYTEHVPYGGVTTGPANTYALATPAIAALAVGMAISVKFNVDSTGASTLNWNGKGAKGIKKSNGTDVTNLKATGIYTLRYDGANFILQGEGGGGTALAADIVLGKTATVDSGDIVGTRVSYAVGDKVPSNKIMQQTKQLFKVSGAQTVNVAVDKYGNSYASDSSGHVRKLDKDGNLIWYKQYLTNTASTFIAVKGDFLCVSGGATTRVTRFDLEMTTSYAEYAYSTQFNQPNCITMNNAGEMFVSYRNTAGTFILIIKVNVNGTLAWTYTCAGNVANNPNCITFDEVTQCLYFVLADDILYKVNNSGALVTSIATGLAANTQVNTTIVLSTGEIILTPFGGTNTSIIKVNAAMNAVTSIPFSSITSMLLTPDKIDIDGKDNIYFASNGTTTTPALYSGYVGKLDRLVDGTYVLAWMHLYQSTTSVPAPKGVAYDPVNIALFMGTDTGWTYRFVNEITILA